MNFFNSKKKQQEKEQKEKLAELRSLWLDYSVWYYQYDIQYRCPITGKIKTHKFHYKIDRKTQKNSKESKDQCHEIVAMKKAQEFLHQDVAYHSGHGHGIVIHDPVQVKFHEITKKQYNKAT